MSDDFDFTDLRAHWYESAKKEKAERESWTSNAMRAAHSSYNELRKEGWRPAMYCPKDGSVFLAWSPQQPTPYRCKYVGTWPDGKWWAMVYGDVWPDFPVLWKGIPREEHRGMRDDT